MKGNTNYRDFYKALCAWNQNKNFDTFKAIYIHGFTYKNPYWRPLYRLYKIIKNTVTDTYKQCEVDFKYKWDIVKYDLTIEQKQEFASDPNTPSIFLANLAHDTNHKVQIMAILNPNMPDWKLNQLVNHENWGIRHAIAMNPNVHIDTLKILAKDENFNVQILAERKLREKEQNLDKTIADLEKNKSQNSRQNKINSINEKAR